MTPAEAVEGVGVDRTMAGGGVSGRKRDGECVSRIDGEKGRGGKWKGESVRLLEWLKRRVRGM